MIALRLLLIPVLASPMALLSPRRANPAEIQPGQRLDKKKTVKIFLSVGVIAVALLAFVYLSLRATSALHQGYAWDEMDWNQDGTTTLEEFLASGGIGKRKVIQGGQQPCAEYFAYKDGKSIKSVCPKQGGLAP
ncbi:MAG: hypothetical protein ACHQIO_06135 [Nevskiales bacterium]